MPPILRSRLAVAALLGAFLIPIGMSSLRGLTHVLTCTEQVESPFTVVVGESGGPLVVSSTRLAAGEESGLCGGLDVVMSARPTGEERLELTVEVLNRTSHPWQGTIDLALDGNSIPVDIGKVAAGKAEQDTVVFRLDPGTHEVEGSLLIGP